MTRTRAVFRYLLITGLKLALIGLVLVAGYLIYLDASLTKRFSSNRFQAPALVYARSLELVPGSTIAAPTVIAELERLSYQRVTQITDSGQYQQSGSSLTIYRRPFDFADGPAMAQRVRLEFAAGSIRAIQSLPDGRALNRFRLEAPLLGRLAGGSDEDRLLVGLELVPNLLIETLLLVEDRDFYHHAGISVSSIARAAVANLIAMRTVQGGSTLTQQLVKNLYLTRERSLWRKANEALMALIIDYRFSKNEILETYLNEVYFGQDRGSAIHGIGLASRLYFGKQVQELTAADIALLVGVIKGPSYYDPRRYPERALERRDMILQLMLEHNLLDPNSYQVAVAAKLMPAGSGQLVKARLPHYLERVQQELSQIALPHNWQQQGLRVFTYFDPNAQQAAEQALQQQLAQVSKDPLLQGAVVVVNHEQAGIAAVVGDRQPRAVGFNRALNAMRPVGSLVKPLIYAAAFEHQGLELGQVIRDEPIVVPRQGQADWQPQNYDETFLGDLSVYDALVQSRNVPAVKLAQQVGIKQLVAMLQATGVDTPIPEVPALALGSVALSPLQVSEIYAMLARSGKHRPVAAIAAMTDHQGLNLYQRSPQTAQQVFSAEVGYLINYGLRGVINEGTGKTLAQLVGSQQLAGKSGTTNDYRDSWFVAYDQQHVFSVWVGRDDNQPVGLTGSRGALPVVAALLQQFKPQPLQLEMPATVTVVNFHRQLGVPIPDDCEAGLRVPARFKTMPEDQGCSGTVEKKSWWQRLF
ncbi:MULTISPECIES: penicillin-binding protein 1B [Pseudidiomarina]|uniref:Penicillin-binding protein 1B n=2 Tax=Pseudidiomarina TaxID=2800384 RepID=A0A368V0W5_9GAMM|nr:MULTISPECIES: penicillin-binding protein 1B [Pseudidiomarina]PWW13388.1 penicillin-binding protein 1B [Pseudidiomarina maritima]RBP90855.1 penicillin-binding protein 1B [Pseudidiomarina tainanensis]RCW32651.1 penicillin-binding protein 1B [Pseudidiomarina tainanensis]